MKHDTMWSCDESDTELQCYDSGDAIRQHLSVMGRTDWPKTLTALCHQRDKPVFDPDNVVTGIRAGLQSKYGGPGGDAVVVCSHATLMKMDALAGQLCKLFTDNCEPWTCHRVPEHDITVNVMDWARANAPELLADDEPAS